MTERNSCDTLELTKPQIAFLEYCEKFGYGILEVEVKNGQPVMSGIVVRDGVVQHKTKFD